MAQQQVNNTSGFTSCTMQLDGKVTLKVSSTQNPQIEFQVKDSKVVLTKKQWQSMLEMTNNINLAFALLETGTISTVDNKKRKLDDTFQEIVDSLGL